MRISRSGDARPALSIEHADETYRSFVSPSVIVSLTFDDGTRDQYAMRSILARCSMQATFYVNSAAVGKPGYMSWEQLSALAADGNDIGGHTLDHVKLTTVGAREARRQIADDRQALMSHGFRVTDFAYPHGDYDASVEGIVERCGYTSARLAWGLSPIEKTRPNCHRWYPDLAERMPLNPYAIRTVCLGARNTLAEFKNVISRAESSGGGWVTLVFHHIGYSREVGSGNFVSLVVLRRFLEWLERRVDHRTRVLTVRDAISSMVLDPSAAPLDGLEDLSDRPNDLRGGFGTSARTN